MKNKKEIIKNYKKKLNILKKHNKYYFVEDNPKISDSEYDKIKKEIFTLRREFDFLGEIDVEESLVGAPPSNKFKKIRHLIPMLSLSNAFNLKDMQDFLKKINNFLKSQNENINL